MDVKSFITLGPGLSVQSNVCEQARSIPEWSSFQAPELTYHKDGKARQQQTL